MGDIYTITEKIRAFTYSKATMPFLCEWPITKDGTFFNFRRAVRVVPVSKNSADLDIEKDVITEAYTHEIQIISFNFADIDNIAEDLRAGCRDFVPDSDYSVLEITDTPFETDTALVTAKFGLTTTLTGKQ